MHAATRSSEVVTIDSHRTAQERAITRWAGQTPGNRQRRRQMVRRHRIIDVQLSLAFLGAIVAAFTLPSWWGPGLMLAGWVVPALVGAWLDTYRPIGRLPSRRPRLNSLAIAIRLDQGENQ